MEWVPPIPMHWLPLQHRSCCASLSRPLNTTTPTQPHTPQLT
jgi:hypothetical protein